MDLRQWIVAAVANGSSIRAAARRFAIAPSTAIKLLQRVRETGSATPARYGGHRRPLLEPWRDELLPLAGARPDITLAELRDEVRQRFGLEVALSTIHRTLRKEVLTHKESP